MDINREKQLYSQIEELRAEVETARAELTLERKGRRSEREYYEKVDEERDQLRAEVERLKAELLQKDEQLEIDAEIRSEETMPRVRAATAEGALLGMREVELKDARKDINRIVSTYVELFPYYEFTDAHTAIDLIKAEILATRHERDQLRTALRRLDAVADKYMASGDFATIAVISAIRKEAAALLN